MTVPIIVANNRQFRTHNTIFVVSGIVLLCCCAGMTLMGRTLWSTREDMRQASTTAGQYLADIEAHRIGAAYDRLCPATRARVSRESFSTVTAPLSSYEIVGVHVTTSNGRSSAVVSTTWTFIDGSVLNQAIGLAKLGDRWTICDE
jgi:hypothetical protein